MILYPHTAGVSLILKVEGHLRGSRQVPQMARAGGPSSYSSEVWGHSPMENLENLDSQECIFLHSGKEIIILFSSLPI